MTNDYQINLPIVMTDRRDKPTYDLLPYLSGDGRIYEVRLIDAEGKEHQARHQVQWSQEGPWWWQWYQTKGNEHSAEYEWLGADLEYIYRGIDTSPGEGRYYVLVDDAWRGSRISQWCPRFMQIGDIYERNPFVSVHNKADCKLQPNLSGYHRTWLRLSDHIDRWHTPAGPLDDVIVLQWITQMGEFDVPELVEETYRYARDYGLVGWGGNGRSAVIVEQHEPGARPDNKRERIACLEG